MDLKNKIESLPAIKNDKVLQIIRNKDGWFMGYCYWNNFDKHLSVQDKDFEKAIDKLIKLLK